MKRLLVMAIGLIVMASIVGGAVACARASDSAADEAAAPNKVSADASYDGEEVEVAVGGSVIVTLESNPTTGFQWELAGITDQAVLEKADQEFVSPEAANNGTPLVGAPGKEVWTFKALKKGESTISMEYSRPWEKDADPAETFTLTVVVK